VGSNDVSRGSLDLFFFDNNTSSLIEDIIDSSHRIRGSSNFGLENRFLKRRRSGQFTTIIDSSSGGDKLTTSSMNGIGVEDNIHNIDSDGSHVFISHNGFFSSPLESIFHRVFDFIHELNPFSGIN
jgi:hypothetical protein